MPRGGDCDHPACHDYNAGCRQLTDEEIEPRPEDHALAARLVAERWHSTSTKYRTVSRWREPPPAVEDMLRPEVLDTVHGRRLAALWRQLGESFRGLRTNNEGVESMELTIRQWRAFRAAGGRSA